MDYENQLAYKTTIFASRFLSVFLSGVGKPGVKCLKSWYTNDDGTKALLLAG